MYVQGNGKFVRQTEIHHPVKPLTSSGRGMPDNLRVQFHQRAFFCCLCARDIDVDVNFDL